MTKRAARSVPKLSIVPKSDKIDLREVFNSALQSCAKHSLAPESIEAAMRGAVLGYVEGERGFQGKTDVAIISDVDNSVLRRDAKAMAAVKTKPRNGTKRRNSPPMPQGSGWAERVARGLARWRQQQGLSIPEAAEKLGFLRVSWYKLERGDYPATTGQNVDEICLKIGMDVIELLKLGEKP
jgi:hypothetical protein